MQLKSAQLERNDTTEEAKEREALEKELAELDRDLARIDAEEREQMGRIEAFQSYRANIENDER